MRLDPGTADERGFDLTPLIDMVFLLLVFFLASTTFASEEVQMDLTLPEATSGEPGEDGRLLVINVRRDGTLNVGGRVMTVEGLRQRLSAEARRDREQEVRIRGDTQVHFGVVAQVFDACLAASLTRVSIAAQPIADGGGR